MTSKEHKEKCKELRKIRLQIAKELGIDYLMRKDECTYTGECNGTCPMCQYEEELILDKLYELKQSNRLTINKQMKYDRPPLKRFLSGTPEVITSKEYVNINIKSEPLSNYDKLSMNEPPITKQPPMLGKMEYPPLQGLMIPPKPPIVDGGINPMRDNENNVFNEFLEKPKKPGDNK